jgi:hypothetical protein
VIDRIKDVIGMSGRAEVSQPAPATRPDRPQSDWVADAFSLLLAEEQGDAPPVLNVSSTVLSDADIDLIASRVAERLTQGVHGDVVSKIVSDVAERLVTQEIERIKRLTKPAR